MIAAEVKKIGRRNLNQISKRGGAERSGLRRGYSRLKQMLIAYAVQAAKCADNRSVYVANIRGGKMNAVVWRSAHANFRKVLA